MRNWLLEKRKNKKLTMREVALIAKIAESSFSLIESGQRNPSVSVAKRIAKLLDFDWTKFFDSVSEEN